MNNFFKSLITVCFSGIWLIIFIQACKQTGPAGVFDPIEEMYLYNIHEHLFDADWLFYKGEVQGAEMPDFDDTGWRKLDLPHDWSIEDLDLPSEDFKDADPKPEGPFSHESPGAISTGYTLGGTGWYRKYFKIQAQDLGRIVKIMFDGVYMNADFWINGQHIGNHPYGYTAFSFDITPFLKTDGGNNVLAVRVLNEGRNSRWYSGSGIYRHTWLSIMNPLHFDRWGLYITTPEVSGTQTTVHTETTVINYYDHEEGFELEVEITDSDGNKLASRKSIHQLTSGEMKAFEQNLKIDNPQLWSLEQPHLYLAHVNLLLNHKIVDQLSSTFGIRTIDFSADRGFLLNNEKVLIKGGNMHHDNGPLGSAAIDRAEYRRIELMKAFGFNAIRTSHNPPSRQFLDACDKLGVLVLDESFDQWERPKNPNDYNLYFDDWWEKDIESMVLRDRNHPSVIIWSIGNEINERADSSGLILTKVLRNKINSLDPTRPVTAAICSFWDHPGKGWEDTTPAFELLDVAGYNYQWQHYQSDHELFPDRIMLGTESVAKDVYENWKRVEECEWVLGDFLWTGMDYLGEAGIGNAMLDNEKKTWPWFNANCGDIDLCGFKKPQSYFRDVVWGISQLEMAVHLPIPEGRKEIVSFWGWPNEEQNWNWSGKEGERMDVSIYTRCDSVVLELNGKKVDAITLVDSMKYQANLPIVYQPGELQAKGYVNGSVAEVRTLKTTGTVAGIRMTADRENIEANRNDLAYITVELVDETETRVPDAEKMIEFDIRGQGELAGIGNGNPIDIKSFQQPRCTSFRGRCLLIVRPFKDNPGEIIITARSGDLKEETLTITTD